MLLNSAPTTPHGPTPHATTAQIDGFVEELIALRTEMLGGAGAAPASLSAIHPDRRSSACNLIHYLTLRRHDLRSLQVGLATLRLSSLGRAEAHVLASLDAVIGALHALKGSSGRDQTARDPTSKRATTCSPNRRNSSSGDPRMVAEFGSWSRCRARPPSEYCPRPRISLKNGMNCMRINELTTMKVCGLI